MPRYVGGDYRIMAELSLQGKFVEIPEHLYVRRIHSGSTKGNAENSKWLRRYYVGTGAGVRAPDGHLRRDPRRDRRPGPDSRQAQSGAPRRQLARTMASRAPRLLAELVQLVKR